MAYPRRPDSEDRSDILLGDYCRDLFTLNGRWACMRAAERDNDPLAESTINGYALIARTYIIPRIGNCRISDIDDILVHNWIFSIGVSNAMRRNIVSTLNQVLKQAVLDRLISGAPRLTMPTASNKLPGTLTRAEVDKVFPEDPRELRRIWRNRLDHGEEGLAFAGCMACVFFGGARPQEARAAFLSQLLPDIWALLITRQMDSRNRVEEYVKSATARDPRYRGTYLYLQGPAVVGEWLGVKPAGVKFLFTFRGRAIANHLLHDRFIGALKKAGVEMDGRWFKPYCGRFTFETLFRGAMSRDAMKDGMGHVSDIMPEHYDVPFLTERMRANSDQRELVNRTMAVRKQRLEGMAGATLVLW